MFPSDYKTVSAALNSGVPLALTGNSGIAAQFDRFTRRMLDPAKCRRRYAVARRGPLGLSASSVDLVTDHEPHRPSPPAASAADPPGAAAAARHARSISSCGRTCTASCSNRLNLEALAQTDRARAEGEIRALLGQLLAEEATPINLTERETLFAEMLDDVFGLGPLEPLLARPDASTTSWSTPTGTSSSSARACSSA